MAKKKPVPKPSKAELMKQRGKTISRVLNSKLTDTSEVLPEPPPPVKQADRHRHHTNAYTKLKTLPPKKKRMPAPKKPRPRKYETEEQRAEAQREHALKWAKKNSGTVRDIAPLPYETIDWELRLRMKDSLRLFCETIMKPVFYRGWSQDQLRCIQKIEDVMREGGMFSLAMPRGGGKTALCRAGILWGMAYAFRRFMYFIGSTDDKAKQTLEFIKTYWYKNAQLRKLFPEIGHSIYKLENRYHFARGQTYLGVYTHVEWGSDSVRMPCLALPKEIVDWYRTHDEDSVMCVPGAHPEDGSDLWIPKQAGIILTTNGIDGSIRGEALVHPITLEQPRPDLVLLDDIQKEQKANSDILCKRLVEMVDGAIAGLAGPGRHINVLMPCTVIREGDVADTYLNHNLKPEWQGERCSMVTSWPKGITDLEITNETESSRMWNHYYELYRTSLKQKGDYSLCTPFYLENREVMDEGFICSWPERYNTEGKLQEVSAQQHAMHLRFKLGPMFLSEYQNRGRKLADEGEILITADQLAQKVVSTPKRTVPADAHVLVSFIDVQTEVLFYATFACNMDYTGVFVDYGTWPEIPNRYFTKDNTRSWSLLTTKFFERYPQHQDKAIKTSEGHRRAPLDAKIYFALQEAHKMLRSLEFQRENHPHGKMKIGKIAIDTRWGETSEVVKRFIRETGDPELIPYYGASMPATHRQFEEYQQRPGWLFENMMSPHIPQPKWCIRPHQDGMYHMMADVDRLKDFLFARLSSPQGAPGSISLYKADPEVHELFASHLCNSEYPEPTTARGITKNKWLVRQGVTYDNDWLDCACGCMALASLSGASVKTTDKSLDPVIRKLSEEYYKKKGKRNQ